MTPARAALAAGSLVAALAAAACGSVRGVTDGPPDDDTPPQTPPFVDPSHLHFTRSSVPVGSVAPDFTLPRADGPGRVTLSALRGRPVVLVFGSFT